jgi:hypothetical protein
VPGLLPLRIETYRISGRFESLAEGLLNRGVVLTLPGIFFLSCVWRTHILTRQRLKWPGRLRNKMCNSPGWISDAPPEDFLNVRTLDLIHRVPGSK